MQSHNYEQRWATLRRRSKAVIFESAYRYLFSSLRHDRIWLGPQNVWRLFSRRVSPPKNNASVFSFHSLLIYSASFLIDDAAEAKKNTRRKEEEEEP